MASSATADNSQPSSSTSEVVSEYVVKVPKANKKKFNVMRFMSSSTIDVAKWSQVKMERENNMRAGLVEEESPKFGAGSEFGREARDEARRKKYGGVNKNYKVDDQPWILKVGGKTGKKYRGIRGGGITENASYYVFTQASDGSFEAHPVGEWYNFTPIQRYKALSAEEAEEEFGRREKVMNYFSIMLKKRLTLDDRGGGELDAEEKAAAVSKGKKKKAKNELKLTDMDEWLSDSENDSNSEEDDEDKDKKNGEGKTKKKQVGKKNAPKKNKKKDKGSDDEALEESDEGDFDDREVDYMSDSSSSHSESEQVEKMNKQMKGVEDEEGLHKLHVSDEDEEEDEEEKAKQEKEKAEAEGAKKEGAGGTLNPDEKPTPAAEVKQENSKPGKAKGEKRGASSGESSPDSSDSDFDDAKFQSAMFMQKSKKRGGSDNSAGSSRANTPTRPNGKPSKRKQLVESSLAGTPNQASTGTPPNKKAKAEPSASNSLSSSDGISEDAVRRYLMRKPMTTTELLQKFKSKRVGISGDQLVTTIAQILKKLNPEKQTIKGKLYLSIKT